DTPEKRSVYALTPELFAEFYRETAHLWLHELEKGNYISIKLFDDLINLFVKKQVTACGLAGYCSFQCVIEADGSVYPCDFYCLDQYKVGNIKDSKFSDLRRQAIVQEFLTSRKGLSDYCQQCPFLKICHGGCKRMQDAMYVDENQEYCGYQELLKYFLPKINHILEYVH
ncbi:SPASM domain-containing protein, partial [Liquorilactobacillus vini]|uniref:SPASM domain-containing protein n=1 Tax=Liquorilactobacillus vini TaxID=238015 RepID=UPI000AC46ABD